jgi:hypothetical protein
MAARNTKGAQVCMTKDSATGIVETANVTSIGATKPATLVGTGFTAAVNSVIEIKDSGNSKIDGVWIVGAGSTATSIVLAGTDNTGGSTAFDKTNGSAKAYADTDMVCLCLSEFTISRDTGGSISTATFCDPSSSVPSVVVSAGSVSIGGYIDSTAADYQEIVSADIDGKARDFRVTLPGNGHLMFRGTVTGMSYQVPVDGAQSWTAQINLSSAPRHLYV